MHTDSSLAACPLPPSSFLPCLPSLKAPGWPEARQRPLPPPQTVHSLLRHHAAGTLHLTAQALTRKRRRYCAFSAEMNRAKTRFLSVCLKGAHKRVHEPHLHLKATRGLGRGVDDASQASQHSLPCLTRFHPYVLLSTRISAQLYISVCFSSSPLQFVGRRLSRSIGASSPTPSPRSRNVSPHKSLDAPECFVAPTPNGTALISAEGQPEL